MIAEQLRKSLALAACAAAGLLAAAPARAAGTIGTVFYIEMENHNFTQPAAQASPQPILGNPADPYLTSLITPGNPNAAQTAYATAYHNVLATPAGDGPHIHPSEPNYIWQEGGSNFGNATDADPYKGSNVYNAPSVSGLLQASGQSWKAYDEGIDLVPNASGQPTNAVLPQAQWTVPLNGFSGTSPDYVNPYDGSHQYNYAPKHVGQVFFASTNGGTTATPDYSAANPEAQHYAPLERLATDLATNNVARYNVITPDQYNDMHSTLAGGFTYNGVHYTGDAANIAQGDNFLSKIVPLIMASDAYKNNGAIVIWNDETEGGDDFGRTSTEIVISPLAKGNAFADATNLTHSSDIKSLQNLFGLVAPTADGYLTPDVAAAHGLENLFVPGAIPSVVPEPSSVLLMGLGVAGLGLVARRRLARKSA